MNVFKNEVSETLLIPLYMRAKESRRGKDALLHDPVAEQLVNAIPYDYAKFDNAKLSEFGCIVRSWWLDNAVRRFITTHPNAVVVNVGCGLDARCQRTADAGKAVFYELDLPEVIALRRRFIPETETDRYIAGSLLDSEWIETLRKNHPEGDFAFVFEGVVMYFHEEQIARVFTALADNFAGGEIWLDVCGKFTAKNSDKHDAIKNTDAVFRFGLNDGHDIEHWDPRLHLIEQSSQGLHFPNRWHFPMNLLYHFPKILYNFCSLLGYKIATAPTPAHN